MGPPRSNNARSSEAHWPRVGWSMLVRFVCERCARELDSLWMEPATDALSDASGILETPDGVVMSSLCESCLRDHGVGERSGMEPDRPAVPR